MANPVVRELVEAVNEGDRDAFMKLLTPGATLSDDGTERNLEQWVDREIFDAHGHMTVEKQDAEGVDLDVRYRNDMYGEMSTRWHFEVENGRISRIETGSDLGAG